ncbi:hypothetical protein AB0H73_08905 [Streptomyces olivoreticuli]
MTWWKPASWKQQNQYRWTYALAGIGYCIAVLAAFFKDWGWPTWVLVVALPVGVGAIVLNASLTARRTQSEADKVASLEGQINTLKRNAEERAYLLMQEYLSNTFKLSERLHMISEAPPEARYSYEGTLKLEAVHAAKDCVNEVPDVGVSFFDYHKRTQRLVCERGNRVGTLDREGPNGLTPERNPGKYILERIKEGKGFLEKDVRGSENWPSEQDFQTVMIYPVKAGKSLYGVLIVDCPTAEALTKRHLHYLKGVACGLAAGISMCRQKPPPKL